MQTVINDGRYQSRSYAKMNYYFLLGLIKMSYFILSWVDRHGHWRRLSTYLLCGSRFKHPWVRNLPHVTTLGFESMSIVATGR